MTRKKSSSNTDNGGDRHSRSSNELFICFTSRPSAAEAPSLSASLSRRLKSSGSVKGAQSPMFGNVVSGRRNKGICEEPTSPKVTCIGQVRVKGKQRRKKAVMARSRSKRVVGAEASFRRDGERERECVNGGRNQGSWVYQIPVSICDALKAVGSEFNCLLPCSGKSFCGGSSSSGPKGTGEEGKVKRRGSCGAVLARWLMMQENEEVKREVAKELERQDEMVQMERKVEVVTDWDERRMVHEEFEVEITKKDEILVFGEGEEVDGEEKGRVSVCIPPKNALLLMRCRSDPVRMAALANRLWGSPVRKVHAQEEEVEEREEEEEREVVRDCEGDSKAAIVGEDEGERVCEASVSEETVSEAERADLKEIQDEVCEQNNSVLDSELDEKEELGEPAKESLEKIGDPPCSNETEQEKACDISEPQILPQAHSDPVEQATEETTETQISNKEKQSIETKARRSTSCSPSRAKEEKKQRQYRMRRNRSNGGGGSSSREKDSRRHSFSSETDPRRSSFSSVKDGRRSSFSIEGRRWSFSIEQEDIVIAKQSDISKGKKKSKACSPETEQVENGGEKEKEKTEEMERKLEMIKTERKKSGELPDCLLLMMYEPKLSMEVSRETWVRPTDFINWRAHKRHNPPPKTEETKTEDPKTEETKTEETAFHKGDDQKKDAQKVTQEEDTTDLESPVEPAEKNRVKIELPAQVLYAPFVLKRCKSEPMRASARLVADACFWKERHRPIGAVGF